MKDDKKCRSAASADLTKELVLSDKAKKVLRKIRDDIGYPRFIQIARNAYFGGSEQLDEYYGIIEKHYKYTSEEKYNVERKREYFSIPIEGFGLIDELRNGYIRSSDEFISDGITIISYLLSEVYYNYYKGSTKEFTKLIPFPFVDYGGAPREFQEKNPLFYYLKVSSDRYERFDSKEIDKKIMEFLKTILSPLQSEIACWFALHPKANRSPYEKELISASCLNVLDSLEIIKGFLEKYILPPSWDF